MLKINKDSTWVKGAISLSTILTVTLLVVGIYLIVKVNSQDERIKNLETKNVAGAQAQQGADPNAPVDIKKVQALFKKGNIVLGDPKSKVLIVEFSDPSCPYCHVAAGVDQSIAEAMGDNGKQFIWKANGGTYEPALPEIKKLVEEGKASFVPLYANGHGAGEIAAQSLYCAQEQGKFWETHDKLYSQAGYDIINTVVKNDKAQSGKLTEFLADVVDSAKMNKCLTDGKYAKKIAEDMTTAQEIGFSGTPMFIVNTKRFSGAYSFAEMRSEVEAALK